MENNAFLQIYGKNGDEVVIEFNGECKLHIDDNNYTITYDENEKSGMTNTQTCIGINKDVFSLTRIGDYSTSIVFQKGKEFITQIATPYGNMSLSINCNKFDFEIEKDSLTARLNYFINTTVDPIPNSIELYCKKFNNEVFK